MLLGALTSELGLELGFTIIVATILVCPGCCYGIQRAALLFRIGNDIVMDAWAFLQGTAAVAALIAAAFGAYSKWWDVSARTVQRDKGRLLRRAAAEARHVPSTAEVEVFIRLRTRSERRAAEELEAEGHARMQERHCWITVNRRPSIFTDAVRP